MKTFLIVLKSPFWIIELILIWAFIIPFSIGEIWRLKNIWKSPLMILIYWASFILAFIFLLVYIVIRDIWILTIAKSLDQLGNASMGGSEDNTLSGRLGEKIKSGYAIHQEKRLCFILSQLDPTTNTHCISSIE